MKPKVNEVYSFQLKKIEDLVTGQFLEENDSWMLLRNIPVDYVIDGFRILNKKCIVGCFSGKDEKSIKKVIDLKSLDQNIIKIAEQSEEDFLRSLIKAAKILQVELEDDSYVLIGKPMSFIGNRLELKLIETNGAYAELEYINLNEVSSILFDCDYVNSIGLLNEDYYKSQSNL